MVESNLRGKFDAKKMAKIRKFFPNKNKSLKKKIKIKKKAL